MTDRSSVRGDNNGEGSSNPSQKHISASLADPRVLDCCVCKETLRIPTFQCQDGHVACSLCCVTCQHRCPVCSNPIGFSRCRAIENVLESFKISCPNARFGCEMVIPYHKMHHHQEECLYAPCVCPHPSCTFANISRKLTRHFTRKHTGSSVSFAYGQIFTVNINASDKAIILRARNDGRLFVLNNDIVENLGNRVYIHRVAPNSLNPAYNYKISASEGLERTSLVPNHRGQIACIPEFGFLFIPFGVFSHGLKLDLRIWSSDSSNIYIDLSEE